MSQEMNLSEEERKALEDLGQLGATRTRGLPNLVELCQKYQEMRPSLEILARLIRRIPGIGGKAADAIEFLMGIADVACAVG